MRLFARIVTMAKSEIYYRMFSPVLLIIVVLASACSSYSTRPLTHEQGLEINELEEQDLTRNPEEQKFFRCTAEAKRRKATEKRHFDDHLVEALTTGGDDDCGPATSTPPEPSYSRDQQKEIDSIIDRQLREQSEK
jgi:hypothetical protein